jgi:D-alanine-D-alanine ligase
LKTVAVLYNRISQNPKEDELDVLKQVDVVSVALDELGYKPVCAELSFNITETIEQLKAIDPAFVFNLVESVENNDELIYFAPAILNILRLPYTGFPLEIMFISTNKLLTKKQLRYHNINTSEWFSLYELDKIDRNARYILKPLWSEGSLGLDEDSVFYGNDKIFLEKLKNIDYKDSFFIEKFIDGREFNIAMLGGLKEPEVLPLAEIIFKDYPDDKPKVVGYTAKWNSDSFEYKNTIRSFNFSDDDKDLLNELKEVCKRCWNEFKMKGYTRIDIRVDNNKIPHILEINANPCLSPDAGFYAAAKQAGMNYTDIIKRIIKDMNNIM